MIDPHCAERDICVKRTYREKLSDQRHEKTAAKTEQGAILTIGVDRGPWWRSMYPQVLLAILAGGLLGHYLPDTAVTLKPLGDAFIKLVKLVIGPVIFLTVATGIAQSGAGGRIGRTTGREIGRAHV